MNRARIDFYLERIHSKDPVTSNHCGKSAEFALRLGEALNLTEQELEKLKEAAILHDLGKIKVPAEILMKPGALTEEEFAVIKCHPHWGAELLIEESDIDSDIESIVEIVRHHHERYDGRGYPKGLSGEEIPYLAQIVAIADAFDAMTSDRPYRSALSVAKARNILAEERGKQFKPELIDRFLQVV